MPTMVAGRRAESSTGGKSGPCAREPVVLLVLTGVAARRVRRPSEGHVHLAPGGGAGPHRRPPSCVATHRRFPLTPLAYRLLFVHALILILGGHYTYAEVPLGFWVRDALGLARNHYDRLGHFAQGFVPAIVAREILLRRSPLRPGKWLFFLVCCVCLAVSACYEFIEWWAALLDRRGGHRLPGHAGRSVGHAVGHVPGAHRRDHRAADAVPRARPAARPAAINCARGLPGAARAPDRRAARAARHRPQVRAAHRLPPAARDRREDAQRLAAAVERAAGRASAPARSATRSPTRSCARPAPTPAASDRVICVVEEPHNLLAVERTRDFRGRYHVLHGALSPLAGRRARRAEDRGPARARPGGRGGGGHPGHEPHRRGRGHRGLPGPAAEAAGGAGDAHRHGRARWAPTSNGRTRSRWRRPWRGGASTEPARRLRAGRSLQID